MRRSVRGCLALSLFGVVSAVIVETARSYRRTAPAASGEQSGELNRRYFSLAWYVCLRLDAEEGGRVPANSSAAAAKDASLRVGLFSVHRLLATSQRPARQSSLSASTDFPYVGNTAGVAQWRESRTLVQYRELTLWRQRGGGGFSTPLPTCIFMAADPSVQVS